MKEPMHGVSRTAEPRSGDLSFQAPHPPPPPHRFQSLRNGWVAPTSLGVVWWREVETRRAGGGRGGPRRGGRGQEEWSGAVVSNLQMLSRPKVPAAPDGSFRRRWQKLKNKQKGGEEGRLQRVVYLESLQFASSQIMEKV